MSFRAAGQVKRGELFNAGVVSFIVTNELSSSQKKFLQACLSDLQAYVMKYKISPEVVDETVASSNNKKYPGRVFSRVSYTDEGVARVSDALVPGFHPEEGADEFHLSEGPHIPGAEPYPYMEITFDCHVCSDDDFDDEAECENCDGEAEFIYSLSWDKSGQVLAELF